MKTEDAQIFKVFLVSLWFVYFANLGYSCSGIPNCFTISEKKVFEVLFESITLLE